jgi:hypothetical protein
MGMTCICDRYTANPHAPQETTIARRHPMCDEHGDVKLYIVPHVREVHGIIEQILRFEMPDNLRRHLHYIEHECVRVLNKYEHAQYHPSAEG